MRNFSAAAYLALIPAVLIAGCGPTARPHEVAPALATVLAGARPATVEPVVWTDVAKFYTQRNGEPAWVNHKQPTQKATAAIEILHTATDHAFDPADYGEAELTKIYDDIQKLERDTPDIHQRLAEFDVRLTAALLAMGRDVALGRSSPSIIDAKWKSRRAQPDFAATLSAAVDGDLDKFIEQVQPQHPEYGALKKALADVRGQLAKGGWPQVKAKPLKPGNTGRGLEKVAPVRVE